MKLKTVLEAMLDKASKDAGIAVTIDGIQFNGRVEGDNYIPISISITPERLKKMIIEELVRLKTTVKENEITFECNAYDHGESVCLNLVQINIREGPKSNTARST